MRGLEDVVVCPDAAFEGQGDDQPQLVMLWIPVCLYVVVCGCAAVGIVELDGVDVNGC